MEVTSDCVQRRAVWTGGRGATVLHPTGQEQAFGLCNYEADFVGLKPDQTGRSEVWDAGRAESGDGH